MKLKTACGQENWKKKKALKLSNQLDSYLAKQFSWQTNIKRKLLKSAACYINFHVCRLSHLCKKIGGGGDES